MLNKHNFCVVTLAYNLALYILSFHLMNNRMIWTSCTLKLLVFTIFKPISSFKNFKMSCFDLIYCDYWIIPYHMLNIETVSQKKKLIESNCTITSIPDIYEKWYANIKTIVTKPYNPNQKTILIYVPLNINVHTSKKSHSWTILI